MEQERRALRVGLYVIACALVVRLLGGLPLPDFLSDAGTAAFLVYLQTGRVVRSVAAAEPGVRETVPEDTPPAAEESQPMAEPVVFTAEDEAFLALRDSCDYTIELESYLHTPLTWDLTGDEPAVLIIHSHATESYTRLPGQTYEESSSYRTLDEQYNMVRVGERVAQLLESRGIRVVHDKTLHDYPSYNGSYTNSRKTVSAYLEEYPSICLVLDLHRDAGETASGGQLQTGAVVDGKESAQLMLVVGSDAGGLNHPDWEKNMALAAKLHVQLEKQWPGLCRPLCFRNQRFNQDLSSGALLVEVGAAGDTLEEALVAAEALAEGISGLAAGAVTADSTS